MIHNYFSERYPFRCDFYIKPLDLFVELNFYISHGPGHRYNPTSSNDQEWLSIWKSKCGLDYKGRKNRYYGFIETWTYRDPLKFETAKRNNLRYIALYNIEDMYRLVREIEKGIFNYDNWTCYSN